MVRGQTKQARNERWMVVLEACTHETTYKSAVLAA